MCGSHEKVIFIFFILAFGYAYWQDLQANNEPAEYLTQDGKQERAAKE